MTVRPLDTLLALKAISLAPGLTENDRRVAAVLLEHFNRRTSQCDPGIERIAGLVGVSTRTVIRSTQRLETVGLFRKTRHGGHFNRNSYEPVWSRFQEVEVAWRARFNDVARLRATKVSPAQRQPCHLGDDSLVTQTCRSNLPKETYSKRLSGEGNKEGGNLVGRLATRLGNRSADAARAEAERRWTDALHMQFVAMPVTYGEVIEAIDLAMMEAATEAEMRRRGAGLAYVLNKLKLHDIKPASPGISEAAEPAVEGSAEDSTSTPVGCDAPPPSAKKASRE